MKKKHLILCAASSLLLMTSCSKSSDFSNPEGYKQVDGEAIQNAKEVFGVNFDPNHTWSSTNSGEVTIVANSSIEKVQVIAYVKDGVNEDNETVTSMYVLNEAELNGNTQVTLQYDAPSTTISLYAAFYADGQYFLREIDGNSVSLESTGRRALPEGVELPTGEFKIEVAEESYASQRGWNPGEKLYALSDYTTQKMSVPDYSDEFKTTFRAMVFSYFKNKAKNMPLVKSSGLYNDKVYPITTGDDPIIVSPVYKMDGRAQWGNEVYNSDFYYYYFKEEDLGDDPVAYIKSLPKYKAIQFNQVFGTNEDDIIKKRCSYALMYYGDGTPVVGETTGTFQFPKGYKIGFMLRAKTDFNNNTKNGELYADGRLNTEINNWGMFKNSAFGSTDPRGAWLSLEDKLLMCWESGADPDINDLILEVEGGVEGIVVIPETVYNVYTYCFEDSKVGDYDMNDVVIKAERINDTKVKYSVIACGAWDELYIMNINCDKITDNKEVHSLFGLTDTQHFINTEVGGQKYSPVSVTKTVDKHFSLTDPNTQPYIYNKTKGYEIHMAKQGETPHGIMIPNDFQYPKEKVCIKNGYLEFNNWGTNPVLSTDWYTKPVTEKVYK